MANKNPSPNTRFQPGQVTNPGGKPAGAKNRLSGKFLNALADDFEQYGSAVIVTVREDNPVAYLKIVASLIPQQVELTRPMDEITDAELSTAIQYLQLLTRGSDDSAPNSVN